MKSSASLCQPYSRFEPVKGEKAMELVPVELKMDEASCVVGKSTRLTSIPADLAARLGISDIIVAGMSVCAAARWCIVISSAIWSALEMGCYRTASGGLTITTGYRGELCPF